MSSLMEELAAEEDKRFLAACDQAVKALAVDGVFERAEGRGLTHAILKKGGWCRQLRLWVEDVAHNNLPMPELYPYYDCIKVEIDPTKFCFTWELWGGKITAAGGRTRAVAQLVRKAPGKKGRPRLPSELNLAFDPEGLVRLLRIGMTLQEGAPCST